MKTVSKLLHATPSIRNKLALLSFAFLLTTFCLVFALIYHQQKRLLQTQFTESVAAQARLLATNTRAAVIFLDRREAGDLLASLAGNPAIDLGQVRLADGSMLAEFQRSPEAALTIPATTGDTPPLFTGHHLVIREPIRLVGHTAPAGHIELLVSLAQYHQTMQQTIGETLILLFIALTVAVLLTREIVGRLTAPLEALDGLVKRISSNARFDERVDIGSQDEIGRLGRGFNQMLDTLQARDQELAAYRATLEEMVEKRTAALQAAIAEGRQANRTKSDFLARMSHEIRTPMNAITGLNRMVLETPLTARQREHLEQVMHSADALLGIINDILDYSKIEAGGLTLEKTAFDLEQVFQSVSSLFSAKAQAQGLELRFARAAGVPDRLLGDPLRLGQILINLVSNAIKFTARGKIEISVERDSEQADQRIRLAFTVRDTGIGIPAEQQDKLFTPFAQADSSITRRFGGTGLGLAICRQLLELMDGEISLQSKVGEGACFRFTACFGAVADSAAPIAPAAAGNPAVDRPVAAKLPHWRGERVLLVEDIPINRTIALALLKKVGLDVGIATNGQEALDLLDREAFRLVLMDIQMPVMDGLTATRAIRANPRLAGLPVIAMTAHATQEDQQQTREAGMNEHLTKPILPRILYAALSRWLPPGDTEAPAMPVDEAPPATLPPELPGIDQDKGCALHLNRPELYLRSLHAFRDDFAGVTIRLRQHLAAGELPEARRLAHSLKSVAGSLGADQLGAAARRLEEALAAEQAWAANEDALDRLEDAFNTVGRGLVGLPALTCQASCITPENEEDLEALFDRLAQYLRNADARSEALFLCLRRTLENRPQRPPGQEKTLTEMSALIDDVEYASALEKLLEIRPTMKATQP